MGSEDLKSNILPPYLTGCACKSQAEGFTNTDR